MCVCVQRTQIIEFQKFFLNFHDIDTLSVCVVLAYTMIDFPDYCVNKKQYYFLTFFRIYFTHWGYISLQVLFSEHEKEVVRTKET